jgi:hypothetical protein
MDPYFGNFQVKKYPQGEGHSFLKGDIGVQLVETSDAAGCMSNPSMAAMHGIYWCSLDRPKSML